MQTTETRYTGTECTDLSLKTGPYDADEFATDTNKYLIILTANY